MFKKFLELMHRHPATTAKVTTNAVAREAREKTDEALMAARRASDKLDRVRQ